MYRNVQMYRYTDYRSFRFYHPFPRGSAQGEGEPRHTYHTTVQAATLQPFFFATLVRSHLILLALCPI